MGFLHKSTKTGISDFRGSLSIGKGELRSSLEKHGNSPNSNSDTGGEFTDANELVRIWV